MTDWTPETNRIPLGLLSDEEKEQLQACKNGWEWYSGDGWADKDDWQWWQTLIYRAKPAPKRIAMWHNVYDGGLSAPFYRRSAADHTASGPRLCVYRIERNEDGSDPQIFVEDC